MYEVWEKKSALYCLWIITGTVFRLKVCGEQSGAVTGSPHPSFPTQYHSTIASYSSVSEMVALPEGQTAKPGNFQKPTLFRKLGGTE